MNPGGGGGGGAIPIPIPIGIGMPNPGCAAGNPGGGGGGGRIPLYCGMPAYPCPGGGIIGGGGGIGGGAPTPCGKALFLRAWAASNRSAGVPCRSPLPSFLNAYETVTGLFMRNWPFIDSIAASDASNESYEMKPNPFEAPVVMSREI